MRFELVGGKVYLSGVFFNNFFLFLYFIVQPIKIMMRNNPPKEPPITGAIILDFCYTQVFLERSKPSTQV